MVRADAQFLATGQVQSRRGDRRPTIVTEPAQPDMGLPFPAVARIAAKLASRASALVPGVTLCLAVSLLANMAAKLEARIFGAPWLEPLVLAILIGTILRTLWLPSTRWQPGIQFSAKTLLEIAVVLLGSSVSAATLMSVQPTLFAAIVTIVATAIVASLLIGRLIGVPKRVTMLVACGNSICGNSAIVAIAPVIGAKSEEVAASIAFTAVLGVAVVIGLPILGYTLKMNATSFGILSGLTVYSVPQVLSASAPFGTMAMQMGTLVKLVRVLMLGPLCITLALVLARGVRSEPEDHPHDRTQELKEFALPPLYELVPWFILGFLGLLALRSLSLLPEAIVALSKSSSSALTIMSMAALGLGVDLRLAARAGARIIALVVASLLVLTVLSLLALRLLQLG